MCIRDRGWAGWYGKLLIGHRIMCACIYYHRHKRCCGVRMKIPKSWNLEICSHNPTSYRSHHHRPSESLKLDFGSHFYESPALYIAGNWKSIVTCWGLFPSPCNRHTHSTLILQRGQVKICRYSLGAVHGSLFHHRFVFLPSPETMSRSGGPIQRDHSPFLYHGVYPGSYI